MGSLVADTFNCEICGRIINISRIKQGDVEIICRRCKNRLKKEELEEPQEVPELEF